MTCRLSLAALVLSTVFNFVSGSSFLKARPEASNDRISAQEVQMSLLSEIEESLGTGSAAKKLHELEAQLRPMYNALPKNAEGGLSHSVVRYALHRLFVLRHGWFVKGLDPAGGSFNSSSPAGILKDQVPAYIQDLFEKRLHGKGMGLHELAVFAATIEHLIHNEAVGRLGATLKVYDILPTNIMTEKEADQVLDTYMMAYILGENLTAMTPHRARELHVDMPHLYLAWGETQEFMRGKRASITAETRTHEINFATLAKVAEASGEQFGKFQDKDCHDLKSKLVAMEDRSSGRIKLSDFYRPALSGDWQFSESVSYLRQLGTLDESDKKEPKVVIANYMLSQSNCIASSSFYSVCCLDECEALIGHLEKEVAAPEAPSDQLASILAKLPSSSVNAPRTLSSSLLKRLHAIAASNHGTVPLHGRLFAQWMHHAFPRECPYPHLSGTTTPMTPDEFHEHGKESTATEQEMREYCGPVAGDASAAASDVRPQHEEADMPWLHEEELLVHRSSESLPAQASPFVQPAASSAWSTLRNLMLIASLVSVSIGLLRMLHSAQPTKKGYENPQKLFV